MGGIEGSGHPRVRWQGEVALAIATTLILLLTCAEASATKVNPSGARKAATVKPEFLSFGVDASQLYLKQSGQPFDFKRPALKKLVGELAPAYIRYSGTKVESTFYDDSGTLSPNEAPEGYSYVLGRDEWIDALKFAADTGLKTMVSTSAGPGPRNRDMSWSPANARELLQRAVSAGHPPAAVQLGNEPNITVYGAWDFDFAAYGKTDYQRDVRDFLALKKELLPKADFVGPGPFFTDGKERPLLSAPLGPDVSTLMAANGGLYDAVSYHQYPAFGESAKCEALLPRLPADPLSDEFLDMPAGAYEYMKGLRDQYAPGKPLWIDEAGNTACGGIDGYSDRFISTFYYLNSLGYLAQQGVEMVTRWTIAGPQPYALIEDETLKPRPDYWAAVLWRRLMGQVSLTPYVRERDPSVRVYSQCGPDLTGGVTTLLLNTSRTDAKTVTFQGTGSSGARVYSLTGALDGDRVSLNGAVLEVSADGSLPAMEGAPMNGDTVTLPAGSIMFVTLPSAGAQACGAPPHPDFMASVKLSAPRQSLRRILKTGRVTTYCKPSMAASCQVGASVSAGQARRIGLKPDRRTKRLLLGQTTVRVELPVRRKVTIALKRKVLRKLRRAPKKFKPGVRLEAFAFGPGIAFSGSDRARLRLKR